MNKQLYVGEAYKNNKRIEFLIHDTRKGAEFDILMSSTTLKEEECKNKMSWPETYKNHMYKVDGIEIELHQRKLYTGGKP